MVIETFNSAGIGRTICATINGDADEAEAATRAAYATACAVARDEGSEP